MKGKKDPAEVPMSVLLEARGVAVIDEGAQIACFCPLHGHDATEVLSVDKSSNRWSCGACGVERGGPIDWLSVSLEISKKHARTLLHRGIYVLEKASSVGRKPGRRGRSSVRALDLPFSAEDADNVVLAGVAQTYREVFDKNAEAKAFLEGRGLVHPGLASHFQLGFANKTLVLRMPFANRLAGGALRRRLRDLGVLRSTGHEALGGCLVIPLFDAEGNVVNLYGRRIDRSYLQGTEHKWTDASQRGLLNPRAFASRDLVITSSFTDALTAWSFGQANVTTMLETEQAKDDLIAAVTQSKTKKLTWIFRRTKASHALTESLSNELAKLGVVVYRALLPHDLDLAGYLATVNEPANALLQVIRSAEWVAGVSDDNMPQKAPAGASYGLAEPGASAGVTGAAGPVKGQPANSADELVLMFADRRWRVRGLKDNRSSGALRINLLVSREAGGFHVDTFDLYSARHRVAFMRQASNELGVDEGQLRRDIGAVLLELEQAQAEILSSLETPKPTKVELTREEHDDALQLLRDPALFELVLDVFEQQGLVGERDNLLLGFLAVTSRKLLRPLGVVLQSSSAAGKSSLMRAMLSVVPEEDQLAYSTLTSQSLFYAPGSDLRHKVLSIAEESGASRASYSLKLLQSEGSLKIASTGKDPSSGRLVSQEYKVEGPVALLLTTTSIEVDEELLNRCIVLAVDESPEQTRRIHERQRQLQSLEGLTSSRDHAALLRRHQNAQRVLRPLRIVNPHIREIVFSDLRVRARRDHQKLLTLIETIAFLHQHQRTVKTLEIEGEAVEYIEVERSDVALATRLLGTLGLVGVHELPPQTLNVLALISAYVATLTAAERTFSRRDLREALGLGDTQLKVHVRRLLDAELLVARRAPSGKGLVYELACSFDPDRSGFGRPPVGLRAASGRGSGGPPISHASSIIQAASDVPNGRQLSDHQDRTSMGATSRALGLKRSS